MKNLGLEWLITCLIVGIVNSIDIYISIDMWDDLHYLEINPIAKWLLELREGAIDLLICIKSLSILMAILGLSIIYEYRQEYWKYLGPLVRYYNIFILGWILAMEQLNG